MSRIAGEFDRLVSSRNGWRRKTIQAGVPGKMIRAVEMLSTEA